MLLVRLLVVYVVSAPVYLSIIVCAFVYQENLDPNPIYAVYLMFIAQKRSHIRFGLFFFSFLFYYFGIVVGADVIDICGG